MEIKKVTPKKEAERIAAKLIKFVSENYPAWFWAN